MEELSALLHKAYGEEAERILAGYCQRPVTLRFNSLKISPQEGKKRLREEGFSFHEVSFYDCAVVLENGEGIAQSPLFEEGEIYLQSLSSMLPPLFVDPKAGESILDMTAAPGGKTTELAALSHGQASITACEKDKFRFGRLVYNLKKQGATHVTPLMQDALSLDPFFSFDKILLDAPCSGSGTVSVQSPSRITASFVEKCASKQEKLLKKALSLLKKGGILLYSTCSVLPRENDEIVRGVLGKEAELCPITMAGLPLLPSMKGTLCVCPDGRYEGFYLAKLIKR